MCVSCALYCHCPCFVSVFGILNAMMPQQMFLFTPPPKKKLYTEMFVFDLEIQTLMLRHFSHSIFGRSECG